MKSGKHIGDTVRLNMNTGQPADTELELESTSSQTMRGVALPRQAGGGYNPYEASTVPSTPGATGQHKIEDMRKLSEWIRMKRDLERKGED